MVWPLWKTVQRFLKKLKIELPYDPAIPLLGILPKKTNLKRYMHPNVHSSTLYNSQDMEANCPWTDKWLKNIWFIYTMEHYSAIKKNERMPFAALWMNIDIIILSEISQKKKISYNIIYHIYDINYMWNLKYNTNELIDKIEIDS